YRGRGGPQTAANRQLHPFSPLRAMGVVPASEPCVRAPEVVPARSTRVKKFIRSFIAILPGLLREADPVRPIGQMCQRPHVTARAATVRGCPPGESLPRMTLPG